MAIGTLDTELRKIDEIVQRWEQFTGKKARQLAVAMTSARYSFGLGFRDYIG